MANYVQYHSLQIHVNDLLSIIVIFAGGFKFHNYRYLIGGSWLIYSSIQVNGQFLRMTPSVLKLLKLSQIYNSYKMT